MTNEERFEQFYARYPRKVSKGAARKAFDKLSVDDGMLNTLLLAIQAQVRYRLEAEKVQEFVPPWKHPSTWLNQQCWLDEIPSHAELRESHGQRFEDKPKDMCSCGKIATHRQPESLCDACWAEKCIPKDNWRVQACREQYRKKDMVRHADESRTEWIHRLIEQARSDGSKIGQG